MSSKKDPADDEDLFRQAMNDVKPLQSQPRVTHRGRRPLPIPRQRELDEAKVMLELLDEPDPLDDPVTGEELTFLRPGLQTRVLRRLKRGQYSVRDEMDLHGMNEETASKVLKDFIDYAWQRDFRCVRVIHGKGLKSAKGPRIKPMTHRLLRRHPKVLAFASCRPVDGGTGAVTVLLSRP